MPGQSCSHPMPGGIIVNVLPTLIAQQSSASGDAESGKRGAKCHLNLNILKCIPRLKTCSMRSWELSQEPWDVGMWSAEGSVNLLKSVTQSREPRERLKGKVTTHFTAQFSKIVMVSAYFLINFHRFKLTINLPEIKMYTTDNLKESETTEENWRTHWTNFMIFLSYDIFANVYFHTFS